MAGSAEVRGPRRVGYLVSGVGCLLLAYLSLLWAGAGWSEVELSNVGIASRKFATSVIFSAPLVGGYYLLSRALGLRRAEGAGGRIVALLGTVVLIAAALWLFLESNVVRGVDENTWFVIASLGCLVSAAPVASRI